MNFFIGISGLVLFGFILRKLNLISKENQKIMSNQDQFNQQLGELTDVSGQIEQTLSGLQLTIENETLQVTTAITNLERLVAEGNVNTAALTPQIERLRNVNQNLSAVAAAIGGIFNPSEPAPGEGTGEPATTTTEPATTTTEPATTEEPAAEEPATTSEPASETTAPASGLDASEATTAEFPVEEEPAPAAPETTATTEEATTQPATTDEETAL